jgi:hypothetical protein
MVKLARRRRGGVNRGACALLLASVPLLGLVGCSGSHDGRAAHPTASAAKTKAPTAPRSLDQEAKPAVALVDQFAPSGYPTTAVASGYDWATHTGQEISETLPGKHLFQIACSGNGRIAVSLAADSRKKDIACGHRSTGISFTGKFEAVIDGAAGNTGTYAWRILAKA